MIVLITKNVSVVLMFDPDQRNCDRKELSDLSRAFQSRRLIKAFRHVCHTCHIHNHIVTDCLPYKCNHNTVNNYLLISKPKRRVFRSFEQIQKRVQKSEVRIIDCRENSTDNYYRQNVRNVKNNTEKCFSFNFFP